MPDKKKTQFVIKFSNRLSYFQVNLPVISYRCNIKMFLYMFIVVFSLFLKNLTFFSKLLNLTLILASLLFLSL